MRVLVTGANGQVGAEVALCLAGRAEVMALDRNALDLSDPGRIAAGRVEREGGKAKELGHQRRVAVVLGGRCRGLGNLPGRGCAGGLSAAGAGAAT